MTKRTSCGDASWRRFCGTSCASSTGSISSTTNQFHIPQLARINNVDHRGIEQCIAVCRSRDIDLHGNHAHSLTGACKATLRGRGLRHRLMKFVVSYHAAKAGCIASMVSEASAPELLLNEFTALKCSSMFHSKPPVVFADKVHALRKAVFPPGGNTDVPASGWDVPQAQRSCGVWGEAPKARRSRGVRGGAPEILAVFCM